MRYYIKIDNDSEYVYIFNNMSIKNLKILNNFLQINWKTKSSLNNCNEYGSRFISSWSTNFLTILHRCGLNFITSVERRIRTKKKYNYDPLLEQKYPCQLKQKSNKVKIIHDIELFNELNNLGMDKQEIKYYNNYRQSFTDVELYDLAQSNSEHSRHWFFNGKNTQLFQQIKNTLGNNTNSLLAFCDNSSVIKGYPIKTIINNKLQNKIYDIVYTAETHNFPTGISPFPGAATGVGGRIRDNQAVGRGGLLVASIAGYCVSEPYYKHNFPSGEEILIKASNGASDYGNKIGEPIIQGFTRSHKNWIKPIMFSGGLGQVDRNHIIKCKSYPGLLVVRLGGPAYPIGIGGGSASSSNQDSLNLKAVQRGDPQMENKLNKVIRACIELNNNIIHSIHDQGAGGLGNVVKEIIYPCGADIYLDNVTLGDKTMSAKEIWISEFQESNVILIDKNNLEKLNEICKRENLIVDCLGVTNCSKKIKVFFKNEKVVEFDLDFCLGDLPQKEYKLENR